MPDLADWTRSTACTVTAPNACTEHQDCCPYEDCPWPVEPGAVDCGEHEEWMT
jgi:hypothetical protein